MLPAQATPPSGVTTTILGVGRFAEIDAKTKTDINPGPFTEFWKARIRTGSHRAGRSVGTAIPARAW
jgi:hypothetical protein